MPKDLDTLNAFREPKSGQQFTEMFNFFVEVLEVKDQTIKVLERHQNNKEIKVFQTHEEFRYAYAYHTIPGYWIRFIGMKDE